MFGCGDIGPEAQDGQVRMSMTQEDIDVGRLRGIEREGVDKQIQ
jgi:hypothetical protein